jgi:5-methylcytosine-specific restriction endonuclease McrA
MFKPSKNPQVDQYTKSWTRRSIPVANLNRVLREDGTKGCVWCGDDLKSKHNATRYCKDDNCPRSAYAWSYPQKEEGMFFILSRQDWCCNACHHDWKPFIETKIVNKFYGCHNLDYKTKFSMYFIKRFKEQIDPKLKPEVDHIVPIYKGGSSLGLDNHQAICYSCHKRKTSVDLSGKRKK